MNFRLGWPCKICLGVTIFAVFFIGSFQGTVFERVAKAVENTDMELSQR